MLFAEHAGEIVCPFLKPKEKKTVAFSAKNFSLMFVISAKIRKSIFVKMHK
jgi:hypothetical protein